VYNKALEGGDDAKLTLVKRGGSTKSTLVKTKRAGNVTTTKRLVVETSQSRSKTVARRQPQPWPQMPRVSTGPAAVSSTAVQAAERQQRQLDPRRMTRMSTGAAAPGKFAQVSKRRREDAGSDMQEIVVVLEYVEPSAPVNSALLSPVKQENVVSASSSSKKSKAEAEENESF
jgi:hypothetical protein